MRTQQIIAEIRRHRAAHHQLVRELATANDAMHSRVLMRWHREDAACEIRTLRRRQARFLSLDNADYQTMLDMTRWSVVADGLSDLADWPVARAEMILVDAGALW